MKAPLISSFQKRNFVLISFLYIFFSPMAIGQIPQGVPKGSGPIDFSSTANVVIFIVLPIIVFVAFIIWRVAINKKRKNDERGL